MKRYLTILLFSLLTAALLAGCGPEKQPSTADTVSDPQESTEAVSPAQTDSQDSVPENNNNSIPETIPDNIPDPAEASNPADADDDMSETVDDYEVVVGEDQVVIFN